MRVTILYPLTNSPHGGGNQFLKLLKKWLIQKELWVDNPADADIALINSHQHVEHILNVNSRFPNLPLVHRIDGPVSIPRNSRRTVDDLIFTLNQSLVSGTVFQSDWSKNKNYTFGLQEPKQSVVIINTPDPEIFFKSVEKEISTPKTKLVASSWSGGPTKGFETHRWLDQNLDFSKYDFTFIGNSPIRFENIKHVPPLKSEALAKELRQRDIYIFPSRIEACSNALLEGLSCGLPTVAFNGSSNPESVQKGGELFTNPSEIPDLIKKIEKNYADYQSKINVSSIDEIGSQYLDFFEKVLTNPRDKSASSIQKLRIKRLIFQYKLEGYLGARLKKIGFG
ncbi:MAG: glycosyltransferase [Chloroflexota bacterium]